MARISRLFPILTILVVSTAMLYGCDNLVAEPSTSDEEISPAENSSSDYTEQIKELYENAKAAGEQVPEDVLAWTKSDVKRIGTWDYKIVSFSVESDEAVASRLNELGDQRWECFWVEPVPSGKRFYMKKPMRSYLQLAGKASMFIPVPGSGE